MCCCTATSMTHVPHGRQALEVPRVIKALWSSLEGSRNLELISKAPSRKLSIPSGGMGHSLTGKSCWAASGGPTCGSFNCWLTTRHSTIQNAIVLFISLKPLFGLSRAAVKGGGSGSAKIWPSGGYASSLCGRGYSKKMLLGATLPS